VAQQVDFFFSPASRYSYLAATQINRLERETGCTVAWRPVHGPDIRKLRGRDPFDGSMLSGQYEPAYRQADAAAWAAFYGVAYQEPREPQFDFELLARGAVTAQRLGGGPGFLLAIARAIWGAGRWPLDEALLLELSTAHGIDRKRFAQELHSEGVAAELAASAREAFERGAFGVPTFFIGSRMFWGNDRLALVRHALLKQAK
jgi:2-hydroxychromene-2-carboxylate isomerase